MALIAVIYAVPPVLWAACVMSKCKDNDSTFIRSIHKRKREVLEEHSPSIFRRLRASKRVSEGAGSGILNDSKKPTTKPQLLVVVVGNFCKQLSSSRNNKARASLQILMSFSKYFFGRV
jgi:hypothetical protein